MNESIVDEHLEFIERLLFHEFDKAYQRYEVEDYPNYDEVLAYEAALETITAVREELDDDRRRVERTAAAVADAFDDRGIGADQLSQTPSSPFERR